MSRRSVIKLLSTVITVLVAISANATVPLPVPAGYQCDAYFTFPAPQSFGGRFFSLGQLDFRNPTSAGVPQPMQLTTRTEDVPGSPVVWVAFSRAVAGRTPLEAAFPPRNFRLPRQSVWVELQQFAQMRVDALDAAGTVIGSQSAPSNTRVFLKFNVNVARLRFDGAETLLYRICWR